MTSTGAAQPGSDDHARLGGDAADALLVAILETSDDAIYGQDPGDQVTSWNRAAERCFGYQDPRDVTMSKADFTARVVAAVLLIVGVVLIVRSVPDANRYVKIRRM